MEEVWLTFYSNNPRILKWSLPIHNSNILPLDYTIVFTWGRYVTKLRVSRKLIMKKWVSLHWTKWNCNFRNGHNYLEESCNEFLILFWKTKYSEIISQI